MSKCSFLGRKIRFSVFTIKKKQKEHPEVTRLLSWHSQIFCFLNRFRYKKT